MNGLGESQVASNGPLTVAGMPRFVNTVSACLICGVSRATIYRWMKLQLVEWAVLPSGRRVIYTDSLLKAPGK